MGFAAGGTIVQKIVRDKLPAVAYDQNNPIRLHIHVLNSALFSHVTGLPSPDSPVSARTYLAAGLPWFTLYDENVPRANTGAKWTPLSSIKSVGGIDKDRKNSDQRSDEDLCCYCVSGFATVKHHPCGHLLCDDCSEGMDSDTVCPASSCTVAVRRKQRIAAPMPAPGKEDEDGVDNMNIDERVVHLKRCAERGVIGTFRLKVAAVSPLSNRFL